MVTIVIQNFDPKKLEEITKRLENFQEMGFKVVAIWECQWNRDPVVTNPYPPIRKKI